MTGTTGSSTRTSTRSTTTKTSTATVLTHTSTYYAFNTTTLTATVLAKSVYSVSLDRNEWFVSISAPSAGVGQYTDVANTFTGTNTYTDPEGSFVPAGTSVCPTITTTTALGAPTSRFPTTIGVVVTYTINATSTTLSTFSSAQTASTTTLANWLFVPPYTFTNPDPQIGWTFSTSVSTGTSATATGYATATFKETAGVSITVTSFSGIGRSSTTFSTTVLFGYTTRTASTIAREFTHATNSTGALLVDSWSWSSSSSGSGTTGGGAQSTSSSLSSSLAAAFGKDFESVEIQNPGLNLSRFLGPQTLHQRLYPVSWAHLVPREEFSTEAPGTAAGTNFPTAFRIPATGRSRADGNAGAPFPSSGSTVLTFLRNTNGGFGTSVASSLYTTFSWSYSKASLTVTSQTTGTSVSGTDTITTTASSSTSAVLDKAGVAPDPQWSSSTRTTTSRFPLGGQQKTVAETIVEGPGKWSGSSYGPGGSSSYTESLSSLRTRTIGTNGTFSVREIIPLYSPRFQPETLLFSRNQTNNP